MKKTFNKGDRVSFLYVAVRRLPNRKYDVLNKRRRFVGTVTSIAHPGERDMGLYVRPDPRQEGLGDLRGQHCFVYPGEDRVKKID